MHGFRGLQGLCSCLLRDLRGLRLVHLLHLALVLRLTALRLGERGRGLCSRMRVLPWPAA